MSDLYRYEAVEGHPEDPPKAVLASDAIVIGRWVKVEPADILVVREGEQERWAMFENMALGAMGTDLPIGRYAIVRVDDE